MRHTYVIAGMVWALLAAAWPTQAPAKTTVEILQEATYAEEIEGDLDKAIRLYDQVIQAGAGGRSYVAQAMFRKANCLLKRGDEVGARTVLERLISDFADQTAVIEKAKSILEDLSMVDLADLMPPETLLYVELGSPGRQVETILAMLEGTPLKDPMAALGQMPPPGRSRILANLLNAGMLAELKKLRGMAVGITAIDQTGPSVVLVLCPGKSDAVRGLIMASLGMAGGRPLESIDGMQMLGLDGGMYAAYDDRLVIVARSLEQLRWSVRQYKGRASDQSLARAGGSFLHLPRDRRQADAVTVWLNVDQAYARMAQLHAGPQMSRPKQITDALLDLANVEDLTARLALARSGLELDIQARFRQGHRCIAYDLIRTPPLTKAAFESVPADAVALLSMALAGPQSGQAAVLSEGLQHVTGLDLGREVFTNIEQVTLFLAPATVPAETIGPLPAVAYCLGLAITSRNPTQTRQVLSTLLGAASVLTTGQGKGVAGQDGYRFSLGSDMTLTCHVGHTGKVTVLSLNRGIVDAAVDAAGTGRSICNQGPLSKAIEGLPEGASKLVMVNVAGAVQLAGQMFGLPEESIHGLAQACDQTTVQLVTAEKVDQLSLNLRIAGRLIEPLMQLGQVIGRPQTGWAGGPGPQTRAASLAQISRSLVIDGRADQVWEGAQAYGLGNSYYGAPSGPQDCSGSFKAAWDANNLYLLVQVLDDDLQDDSAEFWQDDSVEVFIDPDNAKSGSYQQDDCHYSLDWAAGSGLIVESNQGRTAGARYAFTRTDHGYDLEVAIPWATLQLRPKAGTTIGLDIQVNDDDGGGDRDHKIAWNAMQDNAWQSPAVFGSASLAGLVAWWRLDEEAGDKASDSSGNGHTARLYGDPTWLPSGGKVGGALELDGINDWVETGYVTDLPCWSVGVWVKGPNAPVEGSPSGPVHRQKNFQINWNHVPEYMRGAAGASVTDQWYSASFGQLEPQRWYHLVATYDGRTLRAYKDGALVTTTGVDPAGSPDHEPSSLKLGRHSRQLDLFKGTIDDVRIYSHALSDAQVRALFGTKGEGQD